MKTLFLAALVAATVSIVPATAETITVTRPVAHADLDLSRARDVHRLDRRIAVAAGEACGSASSFDLAGQHEAQRCRVATIAAATRSRDALIASARADVTFAAR